MLMPVSQNGCANLHLVTVRRSQGCLTFLPTLGITSPIKQEGVARGVARVAVLFEISSKLT